MIGFDFDSLEDGRSAAAGLQAEAAAAAALGPSFEALSAAAGDPEWCGSGLVLDRGGEAVALRVNADAQGLRDVWGSGSPQDYPFSACGVFWPLRDACTLKRDVRFPLLPGEMPLCGTEKYPLFFRPPGEAGGSACPNGKSGDKLTKDVLSKPLFLHYGWRSMRPGCRDVTERWRVLDSRGRWLMEAFDLVDCHWVTITELAEETDFRITSTRGPVADGARAALAEPGPAPSLSPLPRPLDCYIISLGKKREAAVNELVRRLHKTSMVRAHRSEAWDTRPLRGTPLEPELVHRGVVNEDKQCDCAPILGCALSHSDLWYQFLEGKDPGPWIVLEDDAVLNDVRPVASILRAAAASLANSSPVGAWDIALLGCVGLSGTESLERMQRVSQLEPGLWGPVPFFIGTWGYMISRSGAQRALAECWGYDGGLPYDVDICLSNAGGEGRLAINLTVPNVVLHPGIGGKRSCSGSLELRRTCRADLRPATGSRYLGCRPASEATSTTSTGPRRLLQALDSTPRSCARRSWSASWIASSTASRSSGRP